MVGAGGIVDGYGADAEPEVSSGGQCLTADTEYIPEDYLVAIGQFIEDDWNFNIFI